VAILARNSSKSDSDSLLANNRPIFNKSLSEFGYSGCGSRYCVNDGDDRSIELSRFIGINSTLKSVVVFRFTFFSGVLGGLFILKIFRLCLSSPGNSGV
jgi:hypothetical protein